MNTYCLALNRRRKTNSIPGQSSPRISPFKYTAGEEAPCELEGLRTKGNGSLECHVERLHEGDGPSPGRARASTSCDPQGATVLSAAGCTTAPARWLPPHRRPAPSFSRVVGTEQEDEEDDANLLHDTFAPRPPQGDQGSQDLSPRKPQQRGFCWFWSMRREICQQRSKHLLDVCRRRCCCCISPNFSLFLSSLGCRLHDEKRDSEQIRSAFSHSDDLRRLATFSTLPKNLFSRDRARVRIERSSSSPSGRRSPEIRFAGTSSSSSSVSVGSTRGPGGASFYLPRGALTARRETGAQPAFGKLIIRGATDDTSENEILREARTLVPPFTC